MAMIKGITVLLATKTLTGYDPFGKAIYSETDVSVDNVLVGQPQADDVITTTDLQGKKLVYMLGIPKGDTHSWENTTVKFFGKTFRTFGPVIQGIEDNVPGPWHKKVMVEYYE